MAEGGKLNFKESLIKRILNHLCKLFKIIRIPYPFELNNKICRFIIPIKRLRQDKNYSTPKVITNTRWSESAVSI